MSSLVLSLPRLPPFFYPPSPRRPSLNFSEASFKCPTNNIYRDLYSQPNRLKRKKNNPKMLLEDDNARSRFPADTWMARQGRWTVAFYFILLILFSTFEIGKQPNVAPGFNVFIYLTHFIHYTRREMLVKYFSIIIPNIYIFVTCQTYSWFCEKNTISIPYIFQLYFIFHFKCKPYSKMTWKVEIDK